MIVNEIGSGAFSIKANVHDDNRGSFFELYNKSLFLNHGLDIDFKQDNISFSKLRNTIRGLHYQKPPFEQSKFLFLVSGSILDIFIDIRINSKDFGKCFTFKLDRLGDSLFIPKGFIHGFCTLEDNTILGYKVDQFYNSEHETGVIWNDSSLNISWPFTDMPVISEKDSKLFTWDQFLKNLDV